MSEKKLRVVPKNRAQREATASCTTARLGKATLCTIYNHGLQEAGAWSLEPGGSSVVVPPVALKAWSVGHLFRITWWAGETWTPEIHLIY